jgi:hypothetical protein
MVIVLPTADDYILRPEYYVVLCARRYAAVVEALKLAATDIERREHQSRLSYLLQSGLLEARREQERRQRWFPDDFHKALIEKDGSIISRAITSEEGELLQYAYSVPWIASINQLSAQAMGDLADMFEGWSQSDLTDSVNVARLLGWADGLRCLADAVGEAYTPPEPGSGSPTSLLEFMAERMQHSR